ncbi:MAG: MBL fold metallo-hydrolase [Gemmatimonadota bacterium]
MDLPPFRLADNPGPFTLDGTRSYRVGRRKVVLLDPGPALDSHGSALLGFLHEAEALTIALTHGHGDHCGGLDVLLARLGSHMPGLPVEVVGPGHARARPLNLGELLFTDQGSLSFLPTPGHTRHHGSYFWRETGVLFAGDLVLGEGTTTWVGEYQEAVADYLESLNDVGALKPRVLLPTHGPPLLDVPGILHEYRRHRLARVDAARAALTRLEVELAMKADHPKPQGVALVHRVAQDVYGSEIVRGPVGWAALSSTAALLHHVGLPVAPEDFVPGHAQEA